jgi:hypothetical protein
MSARTPSSAVSAPANDGFDGARSWEIMVINGYNRLAVPGRPALPTR